jgi:peptidoglycan/LPS O-acetylase OafA/YrhL
VKPFYRPQLDAVRALAFFAVLVHHTLPRGPGQPPLLVAFANGCGFGLCLFFVLSAYLITLLLLREKEKSGSIHLRLFYIRRALRIWPLYLLGLAIGFVMDAHHGSVKLTTAEAHWYVGALVMCGNLLAWPAVSVSHLWSISIEEQFYVFFPASVRKLSRVGIGIVALAMILGANVTLLYLTRTHADLDVKVWSNTFVQFEMFAGGVLLALADKRLPRWSTVVSSLALCAVPMLWIGTSYFTHIKNLDAQADSYLTVAAGYGLVALSCCLVIVAMQGLTFPAFSVWLGTISYGLYVFHLPMLRLAAKVLHHGLASPLIACRIPLAVTATVGCAALSYRYFELPFLKLKRRFEVVHSRPATITADQSDRAMAAN